MENNISNILNNIIHSNQDDVFRPKSKFSEHKEIPYLTTGICDNCSHFSIKNGDPICVKNIHKLEIDIPNQKTSIKKCIYFQSTDSKYLTKGDLDIRTLEIGDVVYEYGYNTCIISKILTKPVLDEKDNCMNWTTIKKDGSIINYSHNLAYPHYSVNLYNQESYSVNNIID